MPEYHSDGIGTDEGVNPETGLMKYLKLPFKRTVYEERV
jgi:hypothetical protein